MPSAYLVTGATHAAGCGQRAMAASSAATIAMVTRMVVRVGFAMRSMVLGRA